MTDKQIAIVTGGAVVGAAALIFIFNMPAIAKNIFYSENTFDTANDGFNNPGNIKQEPKIYAGEITFPQATFKSFEHLGYGFAAMIEKLRSYYNSGYTTIDAAINRWAPRADHNDTQSYINFVSQQTGIDPYQDLRAYIFGERVKDIITAMAKKEQLASFPIYEEDLDFAYKLT